MYRLGDTKFAPLSQAGHSVMVATPFRGRRSSNSTCGTLTTCCSQLIYR